MIDKNRLESLAIDGESPVLLIILMVLVDRVGQLGIAALSWEVRTFQV